MESSKQKPIKSPERTHGLANAIKDVKFKDCKLAFTFMPGSDVTVTVDITANGQSIVKHPATGTIGVTAPANVATPFDIQVCSDGLGAAELIRVEVCETITDGVPTECVARYINVGGLNKCKCK